MSGGPPTFAQGDDTSLSPMMRQFLLGLTAPPGGAGTPSAFGPGAAAAPSFGDDVPAATPPGFTGFDPPTPPTGAPTPGVFHSGGRALGHALGEMAMVGPRLTQGFLDGSLNTGSEGVAGRAFEAAGSALTGSMPFGVPKGALRSFGGAATKDDPLAALEASLAHLDPGPAAAPSRSLVDPKAPSWDLYHGTTEGPDFQRFDPFHGRQHSESGALFLAPNPEMAEFYAGHGVGTGTAEAGPRMFRVSVDPGKTGVFDLPDLIANNPEFGARASRVSTKEFLDRGLPPETQGRDAAREAYRQSFLGEQARNAEINAQLKAMGMDPAATAGAASGHGYIGAAIDMAREQGLDTAVIRGLAEHGMGDQVVALTPGRVRSAYAPDQLLYQGAPAAMGIGAAAAALASPGDAQAASLADRIVGAESGGNATAKNPRSSATGAGQFIDSTWLSMIGRYRPDLAGLPRDQILGLRNDPALSREMVDRYGQENGAKLRAAGLPDNDGTRYLGHFLGPGGARAVLSAAPSMPVSQVLQSGQINANPHIAGMTAGQLADWAAGKVGAGAPVMTMPGGSAGPARFGLSGPVPAQSGQAPVMAMPGQAGPAPDAGTGTYGEIEALLKGLAPQKGQQVQEQPKAPALPAIEAPGGRAMSLKEARQSFDASRFYNLLRAHGARGR